MSGVKTLTPTYELSIVNNNVINLQLWFLKWSVFLFLSPHTSVHRCVGAGPLKPSQDSSLQKRPPPPLLMNGRSTASHTGMSQDSHKVSFVQRSSQPYLIFRGAVVVHSLTLEGRFYIHLLNRDSLSMLTLNLSLTRVHTR